MEIVFVLNADRISVHVRNETCLMLPAPNQLNINKVLPNFYKTENPFELSISCYGRPEIQGWQRTLN